MPTVLLIEPSAMIREPLKTAFAAWGFTAIVASSYDQIWPLVAKARPDLVVIEPELEPHDATDVLRRLADATRVRGTGILVLTKNSDRARIIAAGQLGIRHYLLKTGFNLEQFRTRVELALKRAGSKPPAQEYDKAYTGPMVSDDDGIESYSQISKVDDIDHSMSKSEAEELIRSFGQCRALSPTFNYAMKLLNDSNASIESIASSLKRDHALAVRVLKAANGGAYFRGQTIATVEQAAVRIGISELRNIVVGVAVLEQFGGDEFEDFIDIASFWEHSIAVAFFCQEIARDARTMDPEEAFLVGLLHDVGRVVMIEQFGKDYAAAMSLARDLGTPLYTIEKRRYHIDHTDVASILFEEWRLPETLSGPVSAHHLSFGNLKHLHPNMLRQASTLILADRLANAMLLGAAEEVWLEPLSEAIENAEISPNVLDRALKRVPEMVTELKLGLASASNLSLPPPTAHMTREQLGGNFSPRSLIAEGTFDPIALLLSTIAGRKADQKPPTLLYATYPPSQGNAPLIESMKKADEEAGRTLPAIILQAGESKPPEDFFEGRETRFVKLPARADKIISLVFDLCTPDAESNAA